MTKTIAFGLLGLLLSTVASNATCPTWHTLTNGTTANASDLMDDFGVVLTCPNFTGNVGIGTGSPSYPLTVSGAIYNDAIGYFSMSNYTAASPTLVVGDGQYGLSALGAHLYLWTAPSGGFYFDVGGTVQASIASNGAYTQTSDLRLKRDVHTVPGLDMVMKLRGVRFIWKKTGQTDIGVIAQDVAKVAPELVYTDATGTKSVAYGNLVAPLIEAVKELKRSKDEEAAEIRRLGMSNRAYRSELGALTKRVMQLEKNALTRVAAR